MSSDGGREGMDKLFAIALGLAIIGLGLLYLKKSGQLETIREGLDQLRRGGRD